MSDIIKDTLLEGQAKSSVNKLIKHIGDDKAIFKELMVFVFGKDERLSRYASWVMTHCCETQSQLIKPYFEKLIDDLKNEKLHHANKRNYFRVFQEVEIPEKFQGELYDLGIKYALSANETIAVRVFALTTAYNIAKTHPELLNELVPLIVDLNKYSDTPAMTSRTNTILKELRKRKV